MHHPGGQGNGDLLRACAAVAELAVYCTSDWDEARQREHARTVTLLHPLADTP
jgi:hypothetical protein